jgi:hypothetical protein
MSLPELDVARVKRWIDARNEEIPPHAQGQIRYELDIEARSLTIIESRPPWREDFGPEWMRNEVARIRYTKTHGTWQLYWMDRNLKFRQYDFAKPTANIQRLLDEVDKDPTCIFWG